MTIHFNPSFACPFPVIQAKILPVLSDQQKKVFMVALIIFTIVFTVCYAAIRCRKTKLLNGKGSKPSDGKIHEGEVKNGSLNGKGKMAHPDKKTVEETFTDGVVNGP